MLADFRAAARRLRRSPGYALAAAGILTLGIGANAAVFGVVDAALLRPLPYRDPGRLVSAYESGHGYTGGVSWPNFRDWQAGVPAFAELAAYDDTRRTVAAPAGAAAGAAPERVRAVVATPNLFATLRGAPPLRGRTFVTGDGRAGAPQIVVVSEGFWRRALGGDPAAVGRVVRVDGAPATVVGVMPAAFRFPAASAGADLWIPTDPTPAEQAQRGSHQMNVIGRLRPGVSVERAGAELHAVAARLERAYPDAQAGRSAFLRPLHAEITHRARPALLALAGAVALVLAIACANVANLALARGAARRRELSLRAALGATAGRLARDAAAEAVLLTGAAAVAGAALAWLGSGALERWAEGAVPLGAGIGFDGRAFAFLLAAAACTALAFGLAPGLAASRADLRTALASGDARAGEGPAQRRTRSGLVVVQVALSLTLLVGAGLLLRAVAALRGAPLGMDPAGILTAHVPVPAARPGGPGPTAAFFRPVLARLADAPGVQAVGAVSMLPLQEAWMNGGFAVEGAAPAPGAGGPQAEQRIVSPGYFAALRIPVIAGRAFAEDDDAPSAAARAGDTTAAAQFPRGCVLMVNAALARQYVVPSGHAVSEAVGRRLVIDKLPCTVVGVAGDVRQAALDTRALAEMYFPYAVLDGQPWGEKLVLVVRSALPEPAAARLVHDAVRAVDAAQPVYRVLPMDDVVAASLTDRRLYARLFGAFGALALGLAAAGVYAVLAYAVAQRRREVGVRLALGARRGDVVRLVVKQGARLALIGIAAGLAGALALGRALGGLLYGVRPADPATLAGAAALLGAVAMAAAYAPARRAARVDPAEALRAD